MRVAQPQQMIQEHFLSSPTETTAEWLGANVRWSYLNRILHSRMY
jgi:hypothetical protein